MTTPSASPGDASETAAERRVRRRFRSERPAGSGDVDAAERLAALLVEEAPLMPPDRVRSRARHLATELVGLGGLERLLEDDHVTDVLVNGPGEVWVERDGALGRAGIAVDRTAIDRAIERLVGPLGLRADRAHPVVDARLPDGTRVAVVLPPLAVDGPVLAIRRHRRDIRRLEQFGDAAVVTQLRRCVDERRNLVVHGPTGSGKTSLLNALAGTVPAHERIVTIEDVAELRLPGEHVVRLEARPGTAEGVGRVAIRELVRTALRLRPDRIVVGEVRGAEALDMIWALSTGHTGSFSTCHAAGPADALRRLETMCSLAGEGLPLEAIRAQVSAAVDVLVGVARGVDGARRVVSIHHLDAGVGRQR